MLVYHKRSYYSQFTISRECKSERKNSGRRENGNSGNKQMTEMVQIAVKEVLRKLAPDTVFP